MTADGSARDCLAIALDVDDLVAATRLARTLRPWFSVAKVGLELFSAAGPEAFSAMRDLGYAVFADLKLHDIPTTVRRAARVVGALGVDLLTIHASGGEVMLRAGVDGFHDGAAAAGLPTPRALAVTILTSDHDRSPGILAERVGAAVESGCSGVVCAGSDVADVRRQAPRMMVVVPGIRPAGTPAHDQFTAVTPAGAIAAGADLLVVGRAVTAADDPAAAAAALAASLTPPP